MGSGAAGIPAETRQSVAIVVVAIATDAGKISSMESLLLQLVIESYLLSTGLLAVNGFFSLCYKFSLNAAMHAMKPTSAASSATTMIA